MDRVVVRRSGQKPLKFMGEQVVYYRTSPNQAHPNYSGFPGYWSDIGVYRTKRGRYVLSRASYTQWQGETDHFEAKTADNIEELIAYLDDVHPKAAAAIAKELGIHGG